MQEYPLSELDTPIALVHEWFTPFASGGAEQVVHAIAQLLVQAGFHADLAALVESETHRPNSWLSGREIQTSFIQKLPLGVEKMQSYLPLLPLAIEQMDLSKYPIVISSNHLVAKGKKNFDKRQSKKTKDWNREKARYFRKTS